VKLGHASKIGEDMPALYTRTKGEIVTVREAPRSGEHKTALTGTSKKPHPRWYICWPGRAVPLLVHAMTLTECLASADKRCPDGTLRFSTRRMTL
jgi:hypothetical protein